MVVYVCPHCGNTTDPTNDPPHPCWECGTPGLMIPMSDYSAGDENEEAADG
jgi:hypothetical protein